MQKLELHYQPVNGKFSLNKLNLLFVFQVNCPGCFFHGFPLINQLFETFSDNVSFLGLSTAFEDFQLNTISNTEHLLASGSLVGETKKAMMQYGNVKLPYPIGFPVAMDQSAPEAFDIEEAAKKICVLNPNFNTWPAFEQTSLLDKVVKYLSSLPSISWTFTLNQMRGTPTIVLFNEKMEILLHQFGHIKEHEINAEIKRLLDIID